MDPYPKINSVWCRDERGRILVGEFATPEIGYLADKPWEWTEKVDGTNIRLGYEFNGFRGNEHAYIGGRTDNAQIPPKLLNHLIALMKTLPFERVFPDLDGMVTLYGEGYGAGIQKGGGNYIPDGVGFILFDVKVGRWWLKRDAVNDIALKLGLDVVPLVREMTVYEAHALVKSGELASRWPGVDPEGLVGRPKVDLFDRRGDRIITKIKHKDFR